MKTYRDSDVQKEILFGIFAALRKGIKQVKSSELRHAVNKSLGREVHPNNFRPSCLKLEERGLLVRTKIDLDWHLNITPLGLDFVFDEMDKQEEKK